MRSREKVSGLKTGAEKDKAETVKQNDRFYKRNRRGLLKMGECLL